jgi:hypothetical protein
MMYHPIEAQNPKTIHSLRLSRALDAVQSALGNQQVDTKAWQTAVHAQQRFLHRHPNAEGLGSRARRILVQGLHLFGR